VTRAQLQQLRNPSGWPDETLLRAIGNAVRDSVMTPNAKAAFDACRAFSATQGRGLRLVVSLLGAGGGIPGPHLAPLGELPIEALWSDTEFVATESKTPMSRSLHVAADRKPVRINYPLRILLVVAQPSDRPPVDGATEAAAILQVLAPLVAKGIVEVEQCNPPTLQQMSRQAEAGGHHIIHFIGHGSFEIVGNDPTPKPHLCFEDGTAARGSDPKDAEQLYYALRTSRVQLLILTSCTSGAPTPLADPYPVIAFDGIAQGLIGHQGGGPSAVVAMQFDLESKAAPVFSAALYRMLLRRGCRLDEAVAAARAEMIVEFHPGHRCWINPVIYWRCEGGQVFDLQETIATSPLSPAEQTRLLAIDAELEVRLQHLREVAQQPQATRDAVAPLIVGWRRTIDALLRERGQILGETLGLSGGPVKEGEVLQARLVLRLREPATVGNVTGQIRCDESTLAFEGAEPGAVAPTNWPLVGGIAGDRQLMIANASAGQQWAAGEYELARVRLKAGAGTAGQVLRVRLMLGAIVKDGAAAVTIETLDAAVMVDQA